MLKIRISSSRNMSLLCFELKLPTFAQKKKIYTLSLIESKGLRRVCGPDSQEVASGCSKLRTQSRVS
jgi:hypothetical protein